MFVTNENVRLVLVNETENMGSSTFASRLWSSG
jgi:hypothetical protein